MVKEEDRGILAARFREIQSDPEHYHEAWLLAQVLTYLEAPSLAKLLKDTREQVMREVGWQLEHQLIPAEWAFKPSQVRGRVWTGKKTVKTIRLSWKQIDVTPEVAADPRMQNVTVSSKLVKRLKKLIKEQIWLLRRFE